MKDYEEKEYDDYLAGAEDEKKYLGSKIQAIFNKYNKEEVMKAVEEVLNLFQ